MLIEHVLSGVCVGGEPPPAIALTPQRRRAGVSADAHNMLAQDELRS
jgi:hypothetical protein